MNTKNYKIAVDAMGGDYGLKVTVPACISALNNNNRLYIYIVGVYKEIKKELIIFNNKYDSNRLKIINADEIIKMHDAPITALRNKKHSSMRIAINLIKDKIVDACISAGNTGALVAISKFVLKTISNIDRPAIVYPIPSLNYKTNIMDKVYMLDLGANINCSAEQLFQFGIMGSALSENIQNKKYPKLSLLNIGSEEIKGNDNIKKASKMFKDCRYVNYTGYIEGNNILSAKTDVIICDGFIGNIALKSIEGTAQTISKVINNAFNKNIISKIAMTIAYPIIKKIKENLNMNQYNGASLLGINGIVIKSHGKTSINAFESAIIEGINEIKHNIPKKIYNKIKETMKK